MHVPNRNVHAHNDASMMQHQVSEVENERVVVANMRRADTAWKRTVGLLGHAPLQPDEGLWLEPCNGIHTLGMGFALDLVFLDRDGLCLRTVSNVRPWRFCGPVRRARVVIELSAGTIDRAGIRPGRHYRLLPAE